MRQTFIETNEFTSWFHEHLTDDDLLVMQQQLLADPKRGRVIAGCGGLRKLRIADPKRGEGKRGGGQSHLSPHRGDR